MIHIDICLEITIQETLSWRKNDKYHKVHVSRQPDAVSVDSLKVIRGQIRDDPEFGQQNSAVKIDYMTEHSTTRQVGWM